MTAVKTTRALKLPAPVRDACARARQSGHELVSQGCTLFRCVRCNACGFLTDSASMDPSFRARCERAR